MALVEACISARKDRESGFHHCGVSVKLVQGCLSGRKHREICFNHRGMTCGARGVLYMCQERSKRQFSPLWRCCEVLLTTVENP